MHSRPSALYHTPNPLHRAPCALHQIFLNLNHEQGSSANGACAGRRGRLPLARRRREPLAMSHEQRQQRVLGRTRQRVRANPKEMYVQLYNWLRDSTAKNSDTSRWMEFVWHRLFGEEWVSSRPKPTVLCGEEEGASLCYNRDSSGSAKKFPFPQWHPTGATTHDRVA